MYEGVGYGGKNLAFVKATVADLAAAVNSPAPAAGKKGGGGEYNIDSANGNDGTNDSIGQMLKVKRKSPFSVDDSIKGVNPHYLKSRAHQRNCQRCVPTFEMRCRGYDVKAKPAILVGTDDLAKKWDSIFKDADWIRCSSGDGMKQIEDNMIVWGNNARAEVYVIWEGKNPSAHVFVAVNNNGAVIFKDPQSGILDVKNYFNYIKPGSVRICRIDNLEPTSLICDCCEVN
jgi:hypothetical protein